MSAIDSSPRENIADKSAPTKAGARTNRSSGGGFAGTVDSAISGAHRSSFDLRLFRCSGRTQRSPSLCRAAYRQTISIARVAPARAVISALS